MRRTEAEVWMRSSDLRSDTANTTCCARDEVSAEGGRSRRRRRRARVRKYMAQHRASQLAHRLGAPRAHFGGDAEDANCHLRGREDRGRPSCPVPVVSDVSYRYHFPLTKISGDSLKYISKWTIHAVRHYNCNPSRVTGWAGGRPVLAPLFECSV